MGDDGHHPEWLALIADVVGSRRLPDRERAQREIEGVLEQVNREAVGSLRSPLGLIRGDEIQGVLRPDGDPLAWVRRLRYRLVQLQPPVRLRVGLGLGEVATAFEGRHTWELDGPAFHRSREALEAARAARGPATLLRSGRRDLDEGVNALLGLLDALVGRWTAEQWEAIAAYEDAGTYQRAAGRLGIAFQNVQKRCAAAHWNEVRAAEAYLDQLLARTTREAGR
ncbi:SatD family protein [Limnochorda pilosa]|uniref:SatD family (SatD) n=1 Tax=Limnochorda pilosa TaxID=1555112 RepID=A0A0K2SR71_LIMPI|nr:SatD family protein [Limnochorda pilosa]BAS29319.1 hypothetical protein LIP_3507 [Limnochorda pilosa]